MLESKKAQPDLFDQKDVAVSYLEMPKVEHELKGQKKPHGKARLLYLDNLDLFNEGK